MWGADRTVSFVLTGVSNSAALGDEVAPVTVTDADPAPTLSISPSAVNEGDASPTARALTMTLSAPAAVAVRPSTRGS